jgi:hypothetical protein
MMIAAALVEHPAAVFVLYAAHDVQAPMMSEANFEPTQLAAKFDKLR